MRPAAHIRGQLSVASELRLDACPRSWRPDSADTSLKPVECGLIARADGSKASLPSPMTSNNPRPANMLHSQHEDRL